MDGIVSSVRGLTAEQALNTVRSITLEKVFAHVDATRSQINQMLAGMEPLQVAVLAVCLYIVLSALWEFLFQEESLWQRSKKSFFSFVKSLPVVRGIVQREMKKYEAMVERDMLKPMPGVQPHLRLPTRGTCPKELRAMLTKLGEQGAPAARVKEGRVSGTIYVGGDSYEELTALQVHAYTQFAWANPLHTSVFPGVQRMEAEIVAMTASLFHPGPDTCGSVTTGGTESIFMALKAYRDWGRAVRGISRGNVVVPRTAHPAFHKAANYLGLALRIVAEDPRSLRANVKAMARQIDSNTVALVGSCVQYPHGVADDIEALAAVAQQRGIGLHVDSCLGSFLVPFVREAGDLAPFDFEVPGVTSISVDTHKFGMAPKGSSVLLWRDRAWRRHQFFASTDWPGGVYGTVVAGGSRSGAVLAGTWTSLMYFGRDGYKKNCNRIVEVTRRIADGIEKMPHVQLMARPVTSVVAFTSRDFDINRLVHPLTVECGWDVNVLQFPAAMHLCCTLAHTTPGVAQRFLDDLQKCVTELMRNPKAKAEGAGAMYGMSQSVPDRSAIQEVVSAFLDTMLKVQPTCPENVSAAAATDKSNGHTNGHTASRNPKKSRKTKL
eukprot:m.104962 g.104962  ORF g.104962 m.104962 type:complete len:607 (-) comp18914_c0_seq1:80-1900(-)